jgi:lysophospholipase L1-like esterase
MEGLERDLWLNRVVPMADDVAFRVRFSQLEKYLPASRGDRSLSFEQRARLIGVSADDFADHEARLKESLARWSQTLRVGAQLFHAGDRVVVLGDSLTDDRASWFEHLRTLFEAAAFVNLARGGDTSTDAVRRLGWVLSLEPTWAFVAIGTNDTASLLPTPDVTAVSPAETVRNLRVIRDALVTTSATQVWITPGGVDEATLATTWSSGDRPWVYRNARLALLADSVRELEGVTVVDIFDANERAGRFEDGIHPTIAEHQRIARLVLDTIGSASSISVGNE